MREQPRIATERLRSCLQEKYHLTSSTFDFLALGLDYHAGVYRVKDERGTSYLLKVKSGPLYPAGCLTPSFLREQNITAVVAPLPTSNGTLWTSLDDWTVLVYPFIEGDTSWNSMSDGQWQETGSILRQIHQVVPPSSGQVSLRQETFDPTGYANWIRSFEAQNAPDMNGASASQQALYSAWIQHQSTIHTMMTTMEQLAETLQRRKLPRVICHADLHPANLLRDTAGRVHVIDWDDVMLAPKERDFIFIKASSADSEALPGSLTFFQGYGSHEIDWPALTYYRHERVVQDLIVCAEDVLFSEDLGEESRADACQLFLQVLVEDGMIDAAAQASRHIPEDLVPPPDKDA